jgi:hypothetical protein
MAQLDERGSPVPALVTVAITAVLAIWSAYGFSGAGLLRRLPLLRTGLVTIGFAYLTGTRRAWSTLGPGNPT